MRTCPKCNPADKHSWDDCPVPKQPGDEKLYLLILRHGKPAVRISKDIREIEGFHETTCRPMTPGFAKKMRNSIFPQYNYSTDGNWFHDCRHPDRGWDTPSKLPPFGDLIHPEMKQRIAQRGESVPFTKTDIVNTRTNPRNGSNTHLFPSSIGMKRSLKLEDDSVDDLMGAESGHSAKKQRLEHLVQISEKQKEIDTLEILGKKVAALGAKVAAEKHKKEEELAEFLSRSA